MLYGNESISHYTRANVLIWMTMAFQAGLLNIGGFMACHRFVSHVTGFATFFGYEVSQFKFEEALGMLAVPFFFFFGAMLSGQLVDIRLRLHKKPKYYISFGVSFFIISLVLLGGEMGYFGIFGAATENFQNHVLLALLCLACGIQNGTITTVSRSTIRTTHLTGITTDLGIGAVRFLSRKKLPQYSEEESKGNLMRMGIILYFGLGSVIGGIVYSKFGYAAFALPALSSGILFAATLYFQLFRKVHKI